MTRTDATVYFITGLLLGVILGWGAAEHYYIAQGQTFTRHETHNF